MSSNWRCKYLHIKIWGGVTYFQRDGGGGRTGGLRWKETVSIRGGEAYGVLIDNLQNISTGNPTSCYLGDSEYTHNIVDKEREILSCCTRPRPNSHLPLENIVPSIRYRNLVSDLGALDLETHGGRRAPVLVPSEYLHSYLFVKELCRDNGRQTELDEIIYGPRRHGRICQCVQGPNSALIRGCIADVGTGSIEQCKVGRRTLQVTSARRVQLTRKRQWA